MLPKRRAISNINEIIENDGYNIKIIYEEGNQPIAIKIDDKFISEKSENKVNIRIVIGDDVKRVVEGMIISIKFKEYDTYLRRSYAVIGVKTGEKIEDVEEVNVGNESDTPPRDPNRVNSIELNPKPKLSYTNKGGKSIKRRSLRKSRKGRKGRKTRKGRKRC
jgi:hypothetical protein